MFISTQNNASLPKQIPLTNPKNICNQREIFRTRDWNEFSYYRRTFNLFSWTRHMYVYNIISNYDGVQSMRMSIFFSLHKYVCAWLALGTLHLYGVVFFAFFFFFSIHFTSIFSLCSVLFAHWTNGMWCGQTIFFSLNILLLLCAISYSLVLPPYGVWNTYIYLCRSRSNVYARSRSAVLL